MISISKGSKIKEHRKALHLTLKQVAVAVGVAESTVQRWESGNIETIRAERITKLAHILQLPVEEVAGWFNNSTNIPKNTESIDVLDLLNEQFGKEAVMLLRCFQELNDTGKAKILEDIGILTRLNDYTEKRESQKLRNA